MAAAATDTAEHPGTISSSSALLPIFNAARWTIAGNPRDEYVLIRYFLVILLFITHQEICRKRDCNVNE